MSEFNDAEELTDQELIAAENFLRPKNSSNNDVVSSQDRLWNETSPLTDNELVLACIASEASTSTQNEGNQNQMAESSVCNAK